MRLYVNGYCGHKIYLSIVANTRRDLIKQLGGRSFTLQCPVCKQRDTYDVNDVFAEEGDTAIPAGAILGGILGGLIGGPAGLIIGGLLGAGAGGSGDAAEREKVNRFNRDVV